jgi:hypothetical protein
MLGETAKMAALDFEQGKNTFIPQAVHMVDREKMNKSSTIPIDEADEFKRRQCIQT